MQTIGFAFYDRQPSGLHASQPDLSASVRLRVMTAVLEVLCVAVLIIALTVLFGGWWLGNDALTRLFPGYAAMVPSTAFALALAAATVGFATLSPQKAGPVKKLAGVVLLTIAMANGAATLVFDHGVDAFIWPLVDIFQTEQMSPATSLGIALIATGFLATSGRVMHRRLYVFATSAGLALSFLALSVFAFDVSSLYRVSFYTSISLPTALCLFVLFAAMLIKRSEWGWLSLLLDPEQGSANARRVLPLLVGFTIVLILATGLATSADLLDAHFQSSLLAVSIILVLMTVVLNDAQKANLLERQWRGEQSRLAIAQESEREARVAKDAAEAASAMRHSFLANMSHEIRTPMNGVMGFAELLLMTELTKQQREYVEIICESGQSMVDILNDILDLAKIESGTLELVPVAADPRHLVQSTVRLMRAASDRKGLELKCDIDGDVPSSVILDKLRVKQILSNLVGNAIKFTTDGTITVKLSVIVTRESQELEFCVIDTGVGIPKSRQSVIFEQFVRAENALDYDAKGVGLGLPISRNLAEMMNGELTLASIEGEGTVTRLRIPLKRPAKMQEQSESQSECKVSPTDLRPHRILVAEDQDVNRLLVDKLLTNLGYKTKHVTNGKEAVELALAEKEAGNPFDLVLMDLQMPHTDGLSAAREIRRRGLSEEQLPIIALTAFAYERDINDCLAAGMQDHIAKPVKPADMLSKVNYWLGGRSNIHELSCAG